MYNFRTDLALERRDLYKKANIESKNNKRKWRTSNSENLKELMLQ